MHPDSALTSAGKCKGDHVCNQYYKAEDGKVTQCKGKHRRTDCPRDTKVKPNGQPY